MGYNANDDHFYQTPKPAAIEPTLTPKQMFAKTLRPQPFHWGAFETGLQGAAKQIRANNAAKGFGVLPDMSNFACSEELLLEIERQLNDGMDGKAIALIHGEVSEMLEARRQPGWETAPSEHVPEFTAFVEEGADVIIRVLDLFERLGLTEQLAYCIPAKVVFNTTRPFKHGRTF